MVGPLVKILSRSMIREVFSAARNLGALHATQCFALFPLSPAAAPPSTCALAFYISKYTPRTHRLKSGAR